MSTAVAIVRSSDEVDSSVFERVIRCSEADDIFAFDIGDAAVVVIIDAASSIDRCGRVLADLAGDAAVGAYALIETVKSVAAGHVRAAGDRSALRQIVGPWAFTGVAFSRAAATGARDPLAAALAAGLDVQTIELAR